MPNRLQNKVALITGGASGFGLAISRHFLAEGASVFIGDLNPSSAGTQALQTEYPSQLLTGVLNVTSRSDWDAAVNTIKAKWGKLDILVNNAGTSYKNKPTLEVTLEEYTRTFDVNCLGIFHSVQAVFPSFIGQGGGVCLNISSCGADRPRQGLVWYNATKGAVSNATKGLALEYGPQKVRVNSICPLLSGTGLFESFAGVPDTPENRQKFLANVPLGRLGEVDDVAKAAVFLCSDDGEFVTGVNMSVDGGRSI